MTTAQPTTPAPGVHPGVPAGEYHQWSALSNSRLNQFKRSPAHYRHSLIQPVVETPAMKLGRFTHAAILEPEEFERRYVRGPGTDKRTKAGKEAWAAAEADFGAENIIKAEDYDRCLAMRDSARKRDSVNALLGGEGACELSITWEDEETGVLCKARSDRAGWKLAGGTVVDLKTTRDAGLYSFEKSLFTFGYHRQGAFYLSGFQTLGVSIRHYAIVAIESEPPHEVAVYRLSEGTIEAGEDEIRRLIKRYAECSQANDWPGYPDEIQDISLPPYAFAQIDFEKERA